MEPVDLFAKRCTKMDDEQLREEIKVHLIALGYNMLTPESKSRTMTLLKEGLARNSMSSNHDDFLITLRILNYL